jgi:hypothetical protein
MMGFGVFEKKKINVRHVRSRRIPARKKKKEKEIKGLNWRKNIRIFTCVLCILQTDANKGHRKNEKRQKMLV